MRENARFDESDCAAHGAPDPTDASVTLTSGMRDLGQLQRAERAWIRAKEKLIVNRTGPRRRSDSRVN